MLPRSHFHFFALDFGRRNGTLRATDLRGHCARLGCADCSRLGIRASYKGTSRFCRTSATFISRVTYQEEKQGGEGWSFHHCGLSAWYMGIIGSIISFKKKTLITGAPVPLDSCLNCIVSTLPNSARNRFFLFTIMA